MEWHCLPNTKNGIREYFGKKYLIRYLIFQEIG